MEPKPKPSERANLDDSSLTRGSIGNFEENEVEQATIFTHLLSAPPNEHTTFNHFHTGKFPSLRIPSVESGMPSWTDWDNRAGRREAVSRVTVSFNQELR